MGPIGHSVTFEQELTSLNEWHFFEEFVYSSTTFSPRPQMEVELADNIVWIGDFLLAFQLKEREKAGETTDDAERRWFQKKVLGVATKQIRDTVAYLDEKNSIRLKNGRGYEFELERKSINRFEKLVVYLPHPLLPADCRAIKHHRSSTAGFIHVISGHDYLGIVRTLLTPAEVTEYLEFREKLITSHEAVALNVPEAALVAQYLAGDHSSKPSRRFLEFIRALEHRADEWDMSGVIKRFLDRTTTKTGPTDYYHIIRELALLKRNELREFKLRYVLALGKARGDEFARPYRIAVPRTGCGFVIIPITRDLIPRRHVALTNLTLAHKYDQRLGKCVGVSIADDTPPWFLADWCYVESEWERDVEMEKWLNDNNPFRPVRQAELPGYAFADIPEKED